jgi:hypothetical protein
MGNQFARWVKQIARLPKVELVAPRKDVAEPHRKGDKHGRPLGQMPAWENTWDCCRKNQIMSKN